MAHKHESSTSSELTPLVYDVSTFPEEENSGLSLSHSPLHSAPRVAVLAYHVSAASLVSAASHELHPIWRPLCQEWYVVAGTVDAR
ncbi:unnamed protein product [Peronospora farinosa]|uniref:Uncharacterized protein n=1 Tax=Peronospora farinosa TaxID=134698 RepID=A0ABN8CDX7_9STRA|nr:unnamed protein product [Peronospora farinosa]